MSEKYLPLGSVVLLKNGVGKIVITGYGILARETGKKIYDYLGCPYPLGMVGKINSCVFMHEDINKICMMGYMDVEYINNNKKLLDMFGKNEKGEL